MSDSEEQVYYPGEIVPESGIYECECGDHHRYSADVRGHRFPPPNEGCRPIPFTDLAEENRHAGPCC